MFEFNLGGGIEKNIVSDYVKKCNLFAIDIVLITAATAN